MTEEERRKADRAEDNKIIGIIAGGVLTIGLAAGAAGYDLGYQAGAKEVKPATHVYGDQTIINNNTVRVNSSD